jgi:hypothetical protein
VNTNGSGDTRRNSWRNTGRQSITATTIAFLLLFTTGLRAQGPTTGSIAGVVTDPSAAPLPDAKVTANSPVLLVSQSTLTGSQGGYRFPSLPPGTYELTVEAPGFAVMKRENIIITSGFNATIDAAMTLAGQSQVVAVNEEAPLIDIENTKLQNVFSSTVLKDIPTARDMWSLIGISPGLSLKSFDVGGSATGTQIAYYAYGITGQQRVQEDGVNMTEANSATSAYGDYSAFSEVQIGTSGNDASMPSPGTQINFIVKSGGNMFHGDFYQDYESPNFQGHNISTTQLDEGVGQGTRITTYHDTNGDIGGPIKKDKLWFFGSARYQTIGTTVTGYPVNNPSSGPAFTTTLSDALYKVTYQINPNNRISQMLNFDRKLQPYRNASNTQYSDAVYNQDLVEWIGNLVWDSTLSSRSFLEVRLGSWGYNWTNQAYKGPDGNIDYRRTELLTGNAAGGYQPQGYFRRRTQLDPTYTHQFDNLLGKSQFFTFGFLTEHETYNFQQYPYKNAVLETFNSAAGLPDFTTPYEVTLYNTPSATTDYLRHNGAFIQDKIRMSRRLTLNLGIRWDYYSANRPQEMVSSAAPYAAQFYQGVPFSNGYTIPASFPSLTIPGNTGVLHWTHSFAPRLGFAYDLFGNGKTTIKASWGRYYENPSLVLSATANPLVSTGYTFFWNATPSAALTAGTAGFAPNQLGSFVSSTGGILNSIGRGIRDPYMDDFNGFIEHEIIPNLVVRVGFVYRKLDHDWVLVETSRLPSLFTSPVTKTDPGATGTGNTPITVWDIPANTPLPSSLQQWQSPDGNNSYFRNLDFSITKRMSNNWTLAGSFLGTWSTSPINGTSGNGFASNSSIGNVTLPLNPNTAQYNIASVYNANFRAFATYNAKWGITITPVYRFQLGAPLARYITVTGLHVGSETIPVTPLGAYRQDNISILDTRVEKHFTFKDRYIIGLFFDAFNINNSNADQTQGNVVATKTAVVNGTKYSYQQFLSPTTVISPRIFRIGAKFTF